MAAWFFFLILARLRVALDKAKAPGVRGCPPIGGGIVGGGRRLPLEKEYSLARGGCLGSVVYPQEVCKPSPA